jgi:ribosomal peptide maturation radical SAM protein 1
MAMQVLLLSLPWAPFNRPSIQLGVLKAFLDQQCPGLRVVSRHPSLTAAATIGTDRYHRISEKTWAGEALYSGLLFAELRDAARRLFQRELPDLGKAAYDDLLLLLDAHMDTCLEGVLGTDFRLVGFSVCFSQLSASLLAATRLKARRPDLLVVFGGSVVTPELARSLPGAFPAVDYCIPGEGEGPLQGLVSFLQGITTSWPAGVFAAGGQGLDPGSPPRPMTIADLDSLPLPDYTDYFAELGLSGLNFIPHLPVEFSRGCWWNRCAFCNLNLQWQGYRNKSHGRMLTEIRTLTSRHRCLDFSFTDNALPPAEAGPLFRALAAEPVDRRFFAEIRVMKHSEDYALCRRGGLTEVQIGVEALSDSLLTRLRKGVRAIDNLAAMKDALENDLHLAGNLILEFPGSTAAEVEETLAALEAALPFPPLLPATFFLGQGSPVHAAPRTFGLTAVTRHVNYRALYPTTLLDRVPMLIRSGRGDRGQQRQLWAPVRRAMRAWQDFHRQRTSALPALCYRDGGDFLIIRQERPGQPVLHHRLHGQSRAIYLHCRRPREQKELLQTFNRVKEEQLDRFLSDLTQKYLLFQDGGHSLALAVYST